MTCPQPEDRHATREREALIALWRYLARNGDAEAQFQLGLLYCDAGQESDESAARCWLNKAAAQGHVRAQAMLRQLGILGTAFADSG
jgi:TPR repeat protein